MIKIKLPASSGFLTIQALKIQQFRIATLGCDIHGDDPLGGKAGQIVRPARLGPGSRKPLATKRLHADDRPGHVPVHIDIACNAATRV